MLRILFDYLSHWCNIERLDSAPAIFGIESPASIESAFKTELETKIMISAMNILRTGDFNSFCYEREKKQEKYSSLIPQCTAILLKIVYPSFVLMQRGHFCF